MDEDESDPASNPVVERGRTYDHGVHGTVEVVGIWRGVRRVDSAKNVDTDDGGPMIVCYTISDEEEPVAELSDTLDEFLEAIDRESGFERG